MQDLIVNFGGPRTVEEISSFLSCLLCDQEVIRTYLPKSFHQFLFKKIAKKRALSVLEDYVSIGGRSPIYEDTENIAKDLGKKLSRSIYTFHRYLPKTHKASLELLENSQEKIIRVFPMFPQFSYATTGSIALFFRKNLSKKTLRKLRWIASYPDDPDFVLSYQRKIAAYIKESGISEENWLLFFSAHGVPQHFVCGGDPYEKECKKSYHAIAKAFPKAHSRLCFQSKFGPGKWLHPYTEDAAKNVLNWNEGRKEVLFIPLSFTSDHIETLYEIEKLYLPLIQEKGLHAHRLDALNLEPYWIDAIASILENSSTVSNDRLIRKASFFDWLPVPPICCKK